MNHQLSRITVDRFEVAYLDEGEGMPLVCLPPWPFSSVSYWPVLPILKRHLRVIAPDLPGWLGNSSVPEIPLTPEEFVDLVEEFISKLGLSDFAILGHSLGGVMAQHLISVGNILPQKLILSSTFHNGDSILTYKFFKNGLKMMKLAQKMGVPDSLFKAVSSMYFLSGTEADEVLEERADPIKKILLEQLKKANMSSLVESGLSILGRDYLTAKIEDIDTLVLFAENDYEFIKEESMEIAKLAGVDPVVILGAAHHHFATSPQHSAGKIIEFLEGWNGSNAIS